MKKTEFYVGTQLIQDKFIICGINPDLSLASALPEIFRQFLGELNKESLSEIKILIAHQITDLKGQTIRDLNLDSGDYLFFYRPSLALVKLQLIPPKRFKDVHPGWVIEKPVVLIGREDEIAPDIDLTPLLRDPLRVSRKLAWLKEDKNKWTISLHEDGRTPVYVDQVHLEPGKSIDINDESIISFGSSIQEPDLKLMVRLSSN